MDLLYDGPFEAPGCSCRLRLYADPTGPGRIAILARVRAESTPAAAAAGRGPNPIATLATAIVAHFGLDPAATFWVEAATVPRPSRRVFFSLVEFHVLTIPRLTLTRPEWTPIERDVVETLVGADLPDFSGPEAEPDPDAPAPEAPR